MAAHVFSFVAGFLVGAFVFWRYGAEPDPKSKGRTRGSGE